MNVLQLNKMEEILTIPQEAQSVIIGSDAVLNFLYYNSKLNENATNINVSEVRKKYIEVLQQSYIESENYTLKKNIVFNPKDIIKIINKA